MRRISCSNGACEPPDLHNTPHSADQHCSRSAASAGQADQQDQQPGKPGYCFSTLRARLLSRPGAEVGSVMSPLSGRRIALTICSAGQRAVVTTRRRDGFWRVYRGVYRVTCPCEGNRKGRRAPPTSLMPSVIYGGTSEYSRTAPPLGRRPVALSRPRPTDYESSRRSSQDFGKNVEKTSRFGPYGLLRPPRHDHGTSRNIPIYHSKRQTV